MRQLISRPTPEPESSPHAEQLLKRLAGLFWSQARPPWQPQGGISPQRHARLRKAIRTEGYGD